MPNAVVHDMEGFTRFLSTQPLCRWSAQKQEEFAAWMAEGGGASGAKPSAKKNENADLLAALSSMA